MQRAQFCIYNELMGLYNFAYFQVGAKAIVSKGDKILLLTTPSGLYDFPGGRMDESEVELEIKEVLLREIHEELGENFKCKLGKVIFVSKRHYTKNNLDYRVLVIFFEAQFIDGDIELSEEHSSSSWVEPASVLSSPEKFISVDEYKQFKDYCQLII